MAIETLERVLRSVPALAGLADEHVHILVGCAKNARYREGDILFRQGEQADEFFILRQGRVALEVNAPGRGALTIETLDDDDVFGWSWLIPPYLSQFDARAVTSVRVLTLDGACLRGKCERDPALGWALMKVVAPLVAARLNATRMQLLDLYTTHA